MSVDGPSVLVEKEPLNILGHRYDLARIAIRGDMENADAVVIATLPVSDRNHLAVR
jgi:hypothetical protein